jgi:predicted ABC-type ATPase
MKDIVLLGGPNGAGKTTAARVLLPEYLGAYEFVNADELARGIPSANAIARDLAAGRLMILRIRDLVQAGMSFAFETTCAGRTYLPLLERCKMQGWRLRLYYLWLSSPEASEARVKRRVSEGGHNIPKEVIYRRYRSGLWNMRHLYLPLADTAAIYDNGDKGRVLIAEKQSGVLVVRDEHRWSRIEELTSWK